MTPTLTQPTTNLEPGLTPLQISPVARCQFQGRVVAATERCETPIALDPVSSVVWQSLDGSTTIGELADDLAAVTGGTPEERLDQVSWIISSLALHSLLQLPGWEIVVAPRRIRLVVRDGDCIGQTIGLGKGTTVQVSDGGEDAFLVGATAPALLDRATSGLALEERDGEPRDLWFERGAGSASGRERAMYLFDGLGNRHHVTWSSDIAGATLRSTVVGRASGAQRVAVEGTVIRAADGAVLVHPSLREELIDAVRPLTRLRPDLLVPSAIHWVEGEHLLLPGSDDAPLRIRGMLAPVVGDDMTRFRQLLHVARQWDDAHLDAMATLWPLLTFVEVPRLLSGGDLEDLVAGLTDMTTRRPHSA